MEQAQQYASMARKAAEEKAHLAKVVYSGLGALLTVSREEATRIVEGMMDYGRVPKKPIDRLATYQFAQYVVAVRSLGDELDTRVKHLMETINLEAGENAATP